MTVLRAVPDVSEGVVSPPLLALPAWLAAFRGLHQRARAGRLSPAAQREYLTIRAELGRMLLVAQQITREFGHGARQSVRVAWALQVDLQFGAERVRAVTLDVSRGGFAALLGAAPPAGSTVEFSIRLPGDERIAGKAKLAAALPRESDVRASFAFTEVSERALDRLESALFDQILDRLVV